jgi:hypothetical protein
MQNPTAAPTPPAPQGIPGQDLSGSRVVVRDGVTNAEIYRALQSQRDVLRNQRAELEDRREELVQSLATAQPAAARTGIEQRITAIDARLAQLEIQIASVETDVAEAAGLPGATLEPPSPPRSGPPEEFWVLSGLALVIFGIPISIAFARRIWRKSAGVTVATLPPELTQKMTEIERGMDAIAVEVERIGEGQRFVTQLLAEGGRRTDAARALPKEGQ